MAVFNFQGTLYLDYEIDITAPDLKTAQAMAENMQAPSPDNLKPEGWRCFDTEFDIKTE